MISRYKQLWQDGWETLDEDVYELGINKLITLSLADIMWKSGTIAYELFLTTKTNKNRTELTNKPTNKLGRIVEVFIYSKKSKILIS